MFVSASTERGLEAIASRAGDVRRAFTPGAMPMHGDVATSGATSRCSLDPMSVSAPEGDYFVTTDERGRVSYTRDGSLRLQNGAIVGSNGRPMLGINGDGTTRELHIDAVDEALGRVNHLRVASDGTVEYDRASIDARSGAREMTRVIVGRLALARFPAATKLSLNGDGSSAAPLDVSAHVGVSGDGNFGAISPMRREESRVDLDRSLAALHDAYIAFDAMQAAHKAQGSTGKTAMDLLK